MMNIRPALPSDNDQVWSLVKPVLRAGETYPLSRDISRKDGLAYWFAQDKTVFVAEDMETERGKGIAQRLCRHSLEYAKQAGYRGMQYNLVVSTNKAAVHLWKKMGFKIVGTLPGVFHHPGIGDVDAYVMFQIL